MKTSQFNILCGYLNIILAQSAFNSPTTQPFWAFWLGAGWSLVGIGLIVLGVITMSRER